MSRASSEDFKGGECGDSGCCSAKPVENAKVQKCCFGDMAEGSGNTQYQGVISGSVPCRNIVNIEFAIP